MGQKYSSLAWGIYFDTAVKAADGKYYCTAANPDIAGMGVVLSFVLAAVITTTASIAAAFLDAAVMDEKAFFPSKIQRWMHRGMSPNTLEKRRLWRRVLDRLILGLADQQLVSGFALLVCGYITAFPHDIKTVYATYGTLAHWNLLVYMACLSSSTHLACVLTLRKYFDEHRTTGIFRVLLIILFSLFLIPSIIMSYCFDIFLLPLLLLVHHEFKKGRPETLVVAIWYTFQAGVYLYLFFAAIMQLLPGHQMKIKKWKFWSALRSVLGLNVASRIFKLIMPNKLHAWFGRALAATFWYLLFLTPGTVFVVQVFFAITALLFTLAQKFAKPRNIDYGDCSLNTSYENSLGFGQLLSLIFLVLPLLAAWETYIEERNKLRRYSQLDQAGNGIYVPKGSDASLLPMTPMQQTGSGSSYFQPSSAPSMMSNWTPIQQHSSPPAAYYGTTEYTSLYGSPPAV